MHNRTCSPTHRFAYALLGGVVALQRSGVREVAFVTSAIAMYCPMQWNFSVDCTSHYCITFVPAINTRCRQLGGGERSLGVHKNVVTGLNIMEMEMTRL
jgi:hypothetical protein